MTRSLIGILLAAGLSASVLPAPGQPGSGGIQRGKIKKLDVEQPSITLSVDGADHTYALTEETKVFDGVGKSWKEKLQGFKPGAEVFFKAAKQGGKDVLVGLKLA